MKTLDNTFSVDKADESSGFLLWQVTNLWQREIKKALEPYGITHSQFVLMASTHWLTLNGQEVTQVMLSNHTKIDPMTTSTVLRTLQQKKLLKRKEHATDTRAKTVVLTEEGKIIAMETVVIVERFDKEFFAVLQDKTQYFNHNLSAILNKNKK